MRAPCFWLDACSDYTLLCNLLSMCEDSFLLSTLHVIELSA